MLFYLTFVSSYFFFSAKSFYRDVIINKNKEETQNNLEAYYEALPTVLKNILFYTIPFFIYIDYIYEPRPFSIIGSILSITITNYGSNIAFYWAHRYSHINKDLYEYHKIHHEFNEPIGIRAAYSHPIDFIFGNFIPFAIVPILLKTNTLILLYLIIRGNYKTIKIDHNTPNTKNNHHILHHKYYNCNYGDKWIDEYMNTLRTT